MTLLIFYLSLAIGVSFICSISEAVLLSVRPSYIAALEQANNRRAALLKKLNDNLDQPLAAILTANTISHTMGAAGVGAQATLLYGNQYLGLVSALLTIAVLVFSEIIPKTIGATYWKQLAPSFSVLINIMVIGLYPIVWLSEKLTKLLSKGKSSAFTFSRDEIKAMVEISKDEGIFNAEEYKIFTNLMKIRQLSVRHIMTPRPVIFALSQSITIKKFFTNHKEQPFSRIPVYSGNQDNIIGYVLRIDLLSAEANDEHDKEIGAFIRDFSVISDKKTVFEVYNTLMHSKQHIALVTDEYGTVQGLVTLEDVLETIIGLEITDESDTVENMQALAQTKWRERMKSMGINPEDLGAPKK